MQYDYLIVGAGLYGAVFAQQMAEAGKKCLLIEKRSHIGGNCHTKSVEGINVHQYGAHIFHTSNERVWQYINQFADFNHYINSPMANYNGELYNLPFNMNTFNRMWGIVSPIEAKAVIQQQVNDAGIQEPKNLEEQAIKLVGKDIYKLLIEGYTEKQWGRKCRDLPASIIKRLPVRFTYDNNYFNDRWQGIPIGGYTQMIEKMLAGVDIQLNTDYLTNKEKFDSMAAKTLYTGSIDAYFNYCYEPLEYRTVHFENETIGADNYQGVAVMNYTDKETPFTRIIEHKHFEFGQQQKTVISREYSVEWHLGDEPFYPVSNERNIAIYENYLALAKKENNVLFGGRLGLYQYMDMHQVVSHALNLAHDNK
jgi:UDP-galactopyranose mutase